MMHEKFPEGSNLARILRGDFQIHSCSHTSCGRSQHCRPCVAETPAVMSTLSLFNPSMSTKAAEQRTIIQEYGDWYTGRWWVGCYIWYRPLLAVLNVTAHPSTASVAIAVFLYNGPLLCGFNVGITGLTTARRHNHHLSVEVAGSTLGRHCTRWWPTRVKRYQRHHSNISAIHIITSLIN